MWIGLAQEVITQLSHVVQNPVVMEAFSLYHNVDLLIVPKAEQLIWEMAIVLHGVHAQSQRIKDETLTKDAVLMVLMDFLYAMQIIWEAPANTVLLVAVLL